MGWRVYGTNDTEMNVEGVVWGYRGQYRLEDNWSRLKGRPLGLCPMYFQEESRVVGLVLLLSVALRLLSLVEWTVRRKIQETAEPIKGLYPGQPGRKAKSPSAELLLAAFKGINLTILDVVGQLIPHVTPLTPLQLLLLDLWELPPDLFLRLALLFPNPPPL